MGVVTIIKDAFSLIKMILAMPLLYLIVGLGLLAGEIAASVITSRISIFFLESCVVFYRLIITGMVLGGVAILVAIVGCYTAIKKSTNWLTHYVLGQSVVCLASMVLCVYVYVCKRSSTSFTELKEVSYNYNTSTQAETFWNNVQSNGWCCGVKGPEDWQDDIPTSCCTDNPSGYTKYSEKCENKISNRPYTFAEGCEVTLMRFIAKLKDFMFYPLLGVTIFFMLVSYLVAGICIGKIIGERKLSRRESGAPARQNDSVYSVKLFNCWTCHVRFNTSTPTYVPPIPSSMGR